MGDFKWNVDPKQIKNNPLACMLEKKWRDARTTMRQRTAGYPLLTRIAHNQSIYTQDKRKMFSEGSTQAMKRKFRAQTIQRVPDGKIQTQYDKNSIEQVELEFLFRKKVLRSEFDGRDMMKQLWRTFNEAYDYGFACVRTGFEKDMDGDPRVSYKLIQWNDVYPAPDCQFIEEAPWYIIREWISKSDLKEIIDCETGKLKDPTYDELTVKYIIENGVKDGVEPDSQPMADRSKFTTPIESIEVRTFYARGMDEFVTYVPSLNAVLRTVKNYDPRKDIPLHFLTLEPDPEFPLGAPMIMFTMGQQQFADAFQSVAYDTLLLAANPPLMGFGNLTPSKIKMRPRAFWPMGTNQNNKIEPFKVETTTLTQYGKILENVSGNMQKNLNITDATVASDANVSNYSGTAPGVKQQQQDKTIAVNQLQKRVEMFFSEWANHALRSYVGSMSGEHELTMDEEARRRIWDIEMARAGEDEKNGKKPKPSIIHGNKVKVDFSSLSTDMLLFEVRSGSLIESEREEELKNLQQLIVPVSQMMNAVSDEHKPAFEQNIMQMLSRILELSNIDISAQTSQRIDTQLLSRAVQAVMENQLDQQNQIDQLAMAQQQAPVPQEGAQQQSAPVQNGQAMPPVPAVQ